MTPPTLTPEYGPIEPIEDESRAALSGIRRFITLTKLAWTEQTLDNLETTDRVIRSTPDGAQLIRGFGSTPEDPEDTTITRTERAASLLRQGQARRIMAHKRQKFVVSQAHSVQVPASEDIPSVLAKPVRRPQTVDAARWEAQRAKLDAKDRGNMASFDTSGRMKPSHRRSAATARIYNDLLDTAIEVRTDRLAKGSEGNTVPGKIRRVRIKRARNRRDKLLTKLGRTEDSDPEE